MSGSHGFSQRLQAWKSKFAQVMGPKRQGYGELSQLDQPLMQSNPSFDQADQSSNNQNEAYFRQHGVPAPGNVYSGPNRGVAAPGGQYADTANMQTEELRSLIELGNEAAGILWEMAALQNETENTNEVLDSVRQLQARLRGMVSDYKEGNEKVLAQALEVFDTLQNAMAEYDTSLSPRGTSGNETAFTPASNTGNARLPPPSYQQNPFQPQAGAGTAPGQKTQDDEAPLISFD